MTRRAATAGGGKDEVDDAISVSHPYHIGRYSTTVTSFRQSEAKLVFVLLTR